jgi:seryl-tRNA synthetase
MGCLPQPVLFDFPKQPCWVSDWAFRALINYGLEFLHEREYIPLHTPQLMLRDQMAKTAQLSQSVNPDGYSIGSRYTHAEFRFDEELYKVTGDQADKYLIAVSRL